MNGIGIANYNKVFFLFSPRYFHPVATVQLSISLWQYLLFALISTNEFL
jgi:hypothetical protein